MRKSKVLAKLRAGAFARFSAMGHFLPFFVQHSAANGYDGIWLDLEHRTMGDREIQALLAYCHVSDIDCMVRPPTREHSRLYRYLEEGASGLMMPLVDSAAEAARIVAAIKFPPDGNRGLDGAGFDARFGFDAWPAGSNFPADANRETFLLVQIETQVAVAAADEIAAVPGVDCLFIGPGDLRLRLEAAGEDADAGIAAAVEHVAAAARRHGKAWGITAGTTEVLAHYRDLGAQIIPWGGDFALAAYLAQCGRDLAALG
ncbi:MAG TPA: aldolase/citrate lyase family protein [Roseiflexaceae bacterium]|nr:aldolase/citrate lyase family protein [Roseiflexaceae bacterium]HMP38945.1 aldolase/citrate lyase family protein [Roseiflexaceae bacterium]